MLGDEKQADSLLKRIKQVIHLLKSGSLEKILSFLGLAFFALPPLVGNLEIVPDVIKSFLKDKGWIFLLAGGICVISVFLRLWRQAISTFDPGEDIISPEAVKGPEAFGPAESKLFFRLGRRNEIKSLMSRVLDSQCPLVVLRGESGAGKTSLLRAGLTYGLNHNETGRNIPLKYWAAEPENPGEKLLHAITDQIPINGESSLRGFLKTNPSCVIVLDQFEQLSPQRSCP